MGLLDQFDNALNSDGGQRALSLLAAAGPSATPQSFGQRLYGALQMDRERKAEDEDRKARKQMQAMQMQALLAQAEARKQQQAQEQQRRNYLGSVDPSAGPAMPFSAAQAFANNVTPQEIAMLQPQGENPLAGFDKISPKDYTPESLQEFVRTRNPAVLRAAQKEDKTPADWQLYQLSGAPQRGVGFDQWDQARRRAGATNIGMPKIDIKMGDSVAGQVGPMVKDSKIQAGGAVKMFDAADRIEKALDSKLVTTGPLASKIQTVKQFAQAVSGGNDASIRQTQQVIRSLAQMSVEARKQLQGQGQVTESEAAAVNKADGGDIDSLTTGELRDLVALTKRAAHFSAKSHAELVKNMESNEGTRGAAPFYRVQGIDPLLNYTPTLPQIGGSKMIDDLVNKYDKPAGN